MILELIENDDLYAFTSEDLLLELARVLQYERLRKLLQRACVQDVEIIEWVAGHMGIVKTAEIGDEAVAADPDDKIVIACALSASAHCIISGDHHLLDLKKYQGIPIVTAHAFLNHRRIS